MSKSRIYLSPPWTGPEERAAVARAFDSGYVAPCGPLVDEFERALAARAGTAVAAVSSGTAALDLLMQEFHVGPDTPVIASSLTFISTVGPAVHRGAKPVFVDADPDTGTIALPLLEDALAQAHRGAERPLVIAADLYGQCCDYDALEAVCARHGATLLVDAAEAVGATWHGRPAGQAGAAAIYSFNGNKLITTSGGGAVLSRDAALVDRARWRAQQAREPVVWYEHREVGYNYRLSNLLAGVGCAQLAKLDEIVRRKRRIFDFYAAHFADSDVVPFPCADPDGATHWLSVFVYPTVAARDAASARLAAENVECRPVWKPLHLQPAFAGCRVFGGTVAEDFFNRGLCLPSGAGLADADLERIEACL